MSFKPIGVSAATAVERIETAMREDAERIAADYDYCEASLWFQYQRRSFGSYTTTLDGSPAQRDRYFRAWKLAFDRQTEAEEATQQAAE